MFILLVLFSANSISCSYLQKVKDKLQNRPQIEGIESLSDANISSNNQGSDLGIDGLYTVHFSLNSHRLTQSMKTTLMKNKKWMDVNPNVTKMILEGHCDPLGSESYNIGLGQKRAQIVFDYLKSIGLSESKMSLISFGEEKLFSTTKNYLNRRVNFVPQY